MFNTEAIEEKGLEFQSKYVRPGVNDNIQVHLIEGVVPGAGASPYLDVYYKLKDEPAENSTKIRMYMSEKAESGSLKKLKHLGVRIFLAEQGKSEINAEAKASAEKQFDAIGKDSADLLIYGTKLNAALSNKTPIRHLFGGEEFMGKDKEGNSKIKTRPFVGLPPFAECMSTTPTKLVYDSNKSYHYKKLAVADREPSKATGLPF